MADFEEQGVRSMATQPREIDRDIEIPSAEREVTIGNVAAGETWSFSARGRWTNGLVRSGPGGYRNFLADVLQITPHVAGRPWFCLIGQIKGHPGTTFPIGAGCTQTFDLSGTLVAFANDSQDGYSNNRGSVTLRLRHGGVAPTTGAEFGGFIGWWQAVRDMMRRTKGIPFIAALTVGVSAILVFMQQGQDLVRGVGEGRLHAIPLRGCCRSPFCARTPRSSLSRPGAGRASSSLRTMAPIAPNGARAFADLDAARSRHRAVRRQRVGSIQESSQKFLVRLRTDCGRLRSFSCFRHPAPGCRRPAEAARRPAREGAAFRL